MKPHSMLTVQSAAALLALLIAAGCEGTEDGASDVSDSVMDMGTDEVLGDQSEEPDAEADEDASDTPGDPWPDGSTITVDEVRERMEADDPAMLLLNVSDEEFYDLGHLPGSLVIPWDLLADHLDLVDSARHIVIYCRRGVRSESAFVTLQDASCPYVWIMEGGLEAWIAAGNTTVTCDDPSVSCPLL